MLVMLLTRDIIIRLARSIEKPADLLAEVNRELLLGMKRSMFVTMFYGVLDRVTGSFTFASAGHNPLIRVKGRTGEPEMIKTKGYPLGMMAPGSFGERIETGQIMLSTDDWLIMYTDGINEARNDASEEFGMSRFLKTLEAHKFCSPKELTEKILGRLEQFTSSVPQFDDITLLSMKWTAKTVDTTHYSTTEAIHED
jgi:sigma-B regulation protein RsbU (phosphoserine phosphatase)